MNKFDYALNDLKQGFYIVEEGETLKSISEKFCTTETLIIVDNNLKNEVNKNDYLYIRSYTCTYVVKVTDSIETLERKFNLTKEEILKLNKVNYIYPFQKLVFNEKV